jgi:hypothetical protein
VFRLTNILFYDGTEYYLDFTVNGLRNITALTLIY